MVTITQAATEPAAPPPPPSSRVPTLPPRRARVSWRTISAFLIEHSMLIPILLILIVLILVPFGRSVYYSFTDFSAFNPTPHFVALKNYRHVFADPAMLSGLAFTLLFAVVTTVVITALAMPLALIINRVFVGRRFVRAAFFFPAIPSIFVLGLAWKFILSPLGSGAMNTVLGGIFGVNPLPWLADPTLARFSVIMVGIWSGIGWHATLYLAYLQSIPHDYYEVARIDGATSRQQFTYITLPLLTPVVATSTLLLLNGGLNVYALPVAITGGGPGNATSTITQSIIVNGVSQGDYGQAAALSVIYTLAVILIVLVQRRLAFTAERSIS